MNNSISLTTKIVLRAPTSEVWKALTDPQLIKQYFFGVNASGEWKEGNTIRYSGEWEGKEYSGKAKVLQVEDQKLLRHSYYSDMSGLPDEPGSYQIITYELRDLNGKTELTLTETNLPDQEHKERSEKLWGMVLENLRSVLEREMA